jgi:protein-disulfide isomerase
LKARADEILRDPDSPVGGNPLGDVTLVEFFDYNCPYCRRVAPILEEIEQADPTLRFVYKEFPILGPNSLFAAQAALAASRQGKYIAYHKAMMRASDPVTTESAIAIAASLGLDVERLRKDMQDPEIANEIDRNLELAQALRINGTPSFVIGENVFRGALDTATLRALVERARTK